MSHAGRRLEYLQREAEAKGSTGDAEDALFAEALRAVVRGEDFVTAFGLASGYAAIGQAIQLEEALREIRTLFPALKAKTLARKVSSGD